MVCSLLIEFGSFASIVVCGNTEENNNLLINAPVGHLNCAFDAMN